MWDRSDVLPASLLSDHHGVNPLVDQRALPRVTWGDDASKPQAQVELGRIRLLGPSEQCRRPWTARSQHHIRIRGVASHSDAERRRA